MAELCRSVVLLSFLTGSALLAASQAYFLLWLVPAFSSGIITAAAASQSSLNKSPVQVAKSLDLIQAAPHDLKLKTGRIELRKSHTRAAHWRGLKFEERNVHNQEGVNHSTKKKGSIRIPLMHRDAVGSPLRSTVATYSERLKGAIDRSRRREQTLICRNQQHFQYDQDDGRATQSGAKANNTSVVIPVASGIGEYVMPLAIGTPRQSYTTILDTGSDLVWLQCKPCFHCSRQQSPYYDPDTSSSFHHLSCFSPLCRALPKKRCGFRSCLYMYEYGDQSFTAGDYATETLTLTSLSGDNLEVAQFGFGCGHNNQGTFSGAGGLVGLGQGPLSLASQISSVVSNKFSYCLVSIDESETTTSPMVLGDAAEPTNTDVKYTPIITNAFHPTYYYVSLTGISIGGHRLDGIPNSTFELDALGRGGMVFDSGTTVTMLPQAAYEPVVETFEAEMKDLTKADSLGSGLDLCYDVSGLDSVDVPTLTFHFLEADFEVPPSNIFILVDQEGTLCLALQMSSILGIFGNIQQQNFQVIYDRENSRIGFVEADCQSL